MRGGHSARWTTPFKILGAPVRVHLPWLLVAALVGWSMAMGSLPVVYAGLTAQTYRAMSAMIIAGLGLSILLQAFLHTLIGRALGISVDRITLFAFGGVAELHEEPRTALSELGMALAGPLLSVILCAILAFAAGATEAAGAPMAAVGSLTFVATLNLIMAVFNLLPAFPLDGGRGMRALLWMLTGNLARATRIATRLGQVLAVFLIAGGLVQAVRGSLEGGLWTLLIGIFLQYIAHRARTEAEARAARLGLDSAPLDEQMARGVWAPIQVLGSH